MTGLEIFLHRHEHSHFRHSKELMAEIRAGKCVLARTQNSRRSRSTVPCHRVLEIYCYRAVALSRYQTAHACSLREDVLALCDELAKMPEEPVELWSFSMAPYYRFNVFEGANSQRILGCIIAVDQSLMTEQELEELWGIEDWDLVWDLVKRDR
jgi:hypothetical protein